MPHKPVDAFATWLLEPLGELTSLPKGSYLAGVINIREIDSEIKKDEWWSIIVEFDEQPPIIGEHSVKIKFLLETAPWQMLERKSEFNFFRGRDPVARIRVVG